MPEPQDEGEHLQRIYLLLHGIDEKLDNVCSTVGKHEQRITTLEKDKSIGSGQKSVIMPMVDRVVTVVVAAVVAFVTGWVKTS